MHFAQWTYTNACVVIRKIILLEAQFSLTVKLNSRLYFYSSHEKRVSSSTVTAMRETPLAASRDIGTAKFYDPRFSRIR